MTNRELFALLFGWARNLTSSSPWSPRGRKPAARETARENAAMTRVLLATFVLLLATTGFTRAAAAQLPWPVVSQPEPKPKPPKPEKDDKPKKNGEADDKKSDEDEDEKEKEEEEKDRYFAVTGATVHTVTNGVLEGVTILTKNGKIHQIGRNLDLPEETETLDATGFRVYPGLVAAGSRGISGGEPPDDSTDVYSLNMTLALAAGITTAVTGNTAAKTTFGSVDDMIVKRNLFKKLSYSSRQPNARRKLRAAFEKCRQYLRDVEAFEQEKKTDPDAEEPDKKWIKGQFDTCLKLIKHEVVAVFDASRAHAILDICQLAETYRFDAVVRGAYEGWTVAPRMARAGLAAVVSARVDVDRNERVNRENGSSIENAAVLHDHGVPVAITPQNTSITTWGVAGRDLFHLNMEAAFAVRGGLSNAAALRAITIDAARILGIDHRVGSIEVGKDADFVIADGDLLHYMTHARWTVVNGRVAYDKMKDSLFDHIRPGGDRDAPPPDDYWPRRLGAGQ